MRLASRAQQRYHFDMAQFTEGGAFGLPPDRREWLQSEEKFWERFRSRNSMRRDKFWIFLVLALLGLVAMHRPQGVT